MSAYSKKFLAAILFPLLFAGVALLLVRGRLATSAILDSTHSTHRISPEIAAQMTGIEVRERKMAETVWATEMLAQQCGRIFESFWDSLNAATNKLRLVAGFPAGEFVVGQWGRPQTLPHGIQLQEPVGPGSALSAEAWRRRIEEFEHDGWQLVQTEFRHHRFESDAAGQARQSQFYFSAHLTNAVSSERVVLEGDLVVDWAAKESNPAPTQVKRIDVSRVTLKRLAGSPGFQPLLVERMLPEENSSYIDPLILYDLDGDGRSEIILAAKNQVYWRHSEGYRSAPLCRHPVRHLVAAMVADFDGDGAADFLCHKYEGLFLFKGSRRGTFEQPGQKVWPANRDLKYAMTMTCGDTDRDGDLDVFIGQYKPPYEGGAMPTPYYDANDGYPAYLLRNDGQGKFDEVTAASGLGQKRWRRSYSSSFGDVDDDGKLDLVVVSDFAGIDVYRNDGRGRFADVTRQWVAEPHAFGMAHALADFNADGRLDLLMIGMTSPTADRLEHLRLWRPNESEDRTMRNRMTVGNRLYLGKPGGGFEQTALGESLARSGWSWGCSAFDFDNDGFPDVYVANGMESRESVQDYEGEYWLHDGYVGNSVENPAVNFYLKSKVARLRGQGQSYGGYEKNRLYLNRSGVSFVEIGHLMGVALEQDSRNVVADDLDGDGRVDLAVTSFETWPDAKQTLRVYRNTLKESGHWIGFRFHEEGRGKSPIGVRGVIRYQGKSAVRQIVTGDSYRSQHPTTLHFGLGEAARVDEVEIRWADGRTLTLRNPDLNRYHSITYR